MESKKIQTFKDLRVWQKGIELVRQIYQITKSFPQEEQYGLVSQMRRAAISIPSNIAEGFRRRFSREQKQFLNVALGSSAELETQLIIAKELNYLDKNREQEIMSALNYISAMLVTMCKRI